MAFSYANTNLTEHMTSIRGGHPVGRFANGTLWIIGRSNASPYTWKVCVSTDNGATWSNGLTIVTGSSNDYASVTQVGDSLYVVLFQYNVANTAIVLYRVDYASGTCTKAVDAATLKAAEANVVAYGASIDREPDGRLWCASSRSNSSSGTQYVAVEYSDNNGSSWSNAINNLGSSTGEAVYGVALFCLEQKTVLVYDKATSNSGMWTSDRAHSSAVGTWASPTRRVTWANGGSGGRLSGAKRFASTCRDAFAVDRLSTDTTNFSGLRITQAADGTLTYTAIGNLTLSSADTGVLQVIEGRTDGWNVYYMFAASLSTIRWRNVGSGATAWPSTEFTENAVTASSGAANLNCPGASDAPIYGSLRLVYYPIAGPAVRSGTVQASPYSDVILADAPEGFWHLDEASGTTAYDSSGRSRDGTYADSPVLGESGAGFRTGKSVKFVAPNDRCTITGLTTVYQAFSFEVWVKMSDYPASGKLYELISKRSYYAASQTDFPCFLQVMSNGGAYGGLSLGNDYNIDRSVSSAALSKDVWHHIVLTWNGTLLKLYVDGSLVATDSTGAMTISTNTLAYTFGRAASESGGGAGLTGLNGWLDEVAIYNTALSLERIQAHYAACNPLLKLVNIVPLEGLGGVAFQSKIPFEPALAKAVGTTNMIPLEATGYVWRSIPVPLGAHGFLTVSRDIPTDWLRGIAWRALVPLDAMGLWNAIYHRWLVQNYGVGNLEHLWTVPQKAGVGTIEHEWSVLTQDGEDLRHLWRVLEPKLLVLHGEEIQLPYGTIEKVD